MERCNLRNWTQAAIPEKCDLLVADLSFISLRLAIPPILPSLRPDAEAILLIKPQFEAGRKEVQKGGLVLDPAVHERVCGNIWTFFSATHLAPQRLMTSPITGGGGNTEFLIYFRMNGEQRPFPGMT
jgi:23S rRNA (cytidine1920-2'-O)/16S rRNA (cytidine1409-2'-O)-methyltransferase